MELKINNGMVDFLLLSGGTQIANRMSESEAKELIRTGKIQKKGNKIIVDGRFVFELDGEEPIIEKKPEKKKLEKKEELKEEVKEDKPLSESIKGEKISKRKPRKKK